MKRLLKKLVAGAMAGVMSLGLVVTAGATSRGGQYTGNAGLETVKPNSAMTLVLPTTQNDDLNMILDPHGMIALTEGEAWSDGQGRVPTFAEGTNVFFRNKVTNTTAKEVSATLDGATAKARLFKKVVFPTTDSIVYGTQVTTGSPNFYSDLSGTAVTGTYVALDDTTDTVAANTTYAVKTGKTATASVTSGASTTQVTVDEYKAATSVTLLWLFEGETVDKNFASNNATAVTTGNSSTEVSGLSGKDIATITNETNGYKPVVRTLTAYDYSANTDELKVINKTYAPLTVRVQAELSKTGSASTDPVANVTLVDDPAKLVNTKDGKAADPLMYLALVNSAAEDPVVLKDPAAAEIDDDTGEITAYVIGKPNVIRDFTSSDLDPATVKNLDLIKGQPEFEWIDDEDETIKNALNDKLNDYATAYAASNPAPTNFQILYTAATKTFSVSELANQASGDAYTLELELQDEDADDPTKVVAEGGDIPVYVNILSGSDVVARISMVLDGLKAGLLTDNVTAAGTTSGSATTNKGPAVNIVKWETKSEAESSAILPMFASGFKPVADTTVTNYNLSNVQNSSLSASGAAYSYVLRDGVPDSRFSAAKFHLNAGINTVDAWDLANAGSLRVKLIYNVNLYNEADGELPADEEPSVTVVTPGTDAAVTALMNVTLGTGNSSYDEVTAVKYVNAEGAAKTVGASEFTFDADALTVTVKYAISSTKNMVGSTGWTMTFKNTLTNETKDVAFDIHTAS